MPSEKSEKGREAIPEVWEGLGGPARSLGRVGRPYRMSGNGQKPSWKSGKFQDTLQKVREGS